MIDLFHPRQYRLALSLGFIEKKIKALAGKIINQVKMKDSLIQENCLYCVNTESI